MAKKLNLDKDFTETPDTTVFVEDSDVPMEVVEEPNLPPKSSVERTKYILSFLDNSEKFEDTPKVGGLRRLVEMFVGEIIESRTTFHGIDIEHHSAAATHSIKIKKACGEIIGPFDGSGDASIFNNDNEKFVIFPTSLAETRAKGRSYVNALGIVVNASEEFCRGEPLAKVDSEQFGEAKMSDGQLTAIEVICKTANINTNIVLGHYAKQFGHDRIRDILKSEGLIIIRDINKYQQSTPAPENWVGFKPLKKGN